MSQMNPKTFPHNTTFSVQLPYITSFNVVYNFKQVNSLFAEDKICKQFLLWNLSEFYLSKVYLSEVYLSEVCLSEVYTSEVYTSEVYLSEVYLSEVNLSEVCLFGVCITGLPQRKMHKNIYGNNLIP